MSIRRIVVFILIVACLSAVLPSAADAGIRLSDASSMEAPHEPAGFLSRMAAWIADLLASVEQTFTATEGASISSGG